MVSLRRDFVNDLNNKSRLGLEKRERGWYNRKKEAVMKQIKLGGIESVPALAVGCMRITSLDDKGAQAFIAAATEEGLNFFDHADIYGRGECEKVFAKAVTALKIPRDKLFLQSKCGIVPGKMYDFSKEHILSSVEGILKRLNTDHLDSLLLHRPDALMEPEEVAEAFDLLEKQGKVRYFGVSNMRPDQIRLLKKCVRQKIVANQLQFSPMHAEMVSVGLEANMTTEGAVDRDGGILNYCRLHDITVQPWSPFQYGFFEGVYLRNEKFPELNKVINELCEKYEVEDTAIVVAWLCRHPANMQTVTGTMNAARLHALSRGASVCLMREEWYRLYLAAGHILP